MVVVSLAHVLAGDMRVDLRRANVAVSEQSLHGARVGSALQEMRSEAMTKGVRGGVSATNRRGITLKY